MAQNGRAKRVGQVGFQDQQAKQARRAGLGPTRMELVDYRPETSELPEQAGPARWFSSNPDEIGRLSTTNIRVPQAVAQNGRAKRVGEVGCQDQQAKRARRAALGPTRMKLVDYRPETSGLPARSGMPQAERAGLGPTRMKLVDSRPQTSGLLVL